MMIIHNIVFRDSKVLIGVRANILS